ncbi:MAG: hypothetical protein ABIF45_17830 [Pseudomonadota bacterium]
MGSPDARSIRSAEQNIYYCLATLHGEPQDDSTHGGNRQKMERLKKQEDEQFFFRQELRARRGIHPAVSPAWLLNWLFDETTKNGHGLARPLIWLFPIWIAGEVIFENAAIHASRSLAAADALGFSFANLFVFLLPKRELVAAFDPAGFSLLFHFVSSAQTIGGPALLFLIGLALRNRFRMR